jgi:hypothetical protein
MIATNAFYFDQNKLIKVEEFSIEGDKKIEASWYYADDKPIDYNIKSEKTLKPQEAQGRAKMLLDMGKILLNKMKF